MIVDLVRLFEESAGSATDVDQNFKVSISKESQDCFVLAGLFLSIEFVV